MSSEALLSELCSTCYAEKPKYCCPRCKTQTCSLPCYKKHQQRATCSGKRDPAEYQKKSQLATPTGIDRDYNYLKGVELTIDHANRETRDRGIGTAEASKAFMRNRHPDSKLQQYLHENSIFVRRAPKGMSRQKVNKTRVTKSGNVMWTVEFVDRHGHTELHDNCLQHKTLDDIYSLAQREKSNAEKRGLDPQASTTSKPARKRIKKDFNTQTEPSSVTDDPSTVSQAHSAMADPNSNAREEAEGGLAREEQPPEPGTAWYTNPCPSETEEARKDATPREDPAVRFEGESANTNGREPCFFYLLKVGTSSASKVLIPLEADKSLTEALRNQSVLEFPTIYTLPHAPEQLPSSYMLDKQYEELREREEKELEEAMKKAGNDGVPERTGVRDEREASNSMDPNRILDMLKRDVTR